MMKKKTKPSTRETCRPTHDRRKKTRQIHVIDEQSTERDIAIAQADLTNFFLDVLEKHHGF
jgi:hypothetical protein